MTSTSKPRTEPDGLDDASVKEFLLNNPDFFVRHAAVLDDMHIPHDTGGAISLIEHQVGHLRSKNKHLDGQLQSLITIARQNENLSKRLHKLALSLMQADGLVDALSITVDVLRDEFPSIEVIIHLFDERIDPDQRIAQVFDSSADLSALDGLFKKGQPVAGAINDARKKLAFGENHEKIASAVLIPLADTENLGLLALGSQESGRFRSGIGTVFPTALGELVSQAIRIHLKC